MRADKVLPPRGPRLTQPQARLGSGVWTGFWSPLLPQRDTLFVVLPAPHTVQRALCGLTHLMVRTRPYCWRAITKNTVNLSDLGKGEDPGTSWLPGPRGLQRGCNRGNCLPRSETSGLTCSLEAPRGGKEQVVTHWASRLRKEE